MMLDISGGMGLGGLLFLSWPYNFFNEGQGFCFCCQLLPYSEGTLYVASYLICSHCFCLTAMANTWGQENQCLGLCEGFFLLFFFPLLTRVRINRNGYLERITWPVCEWQAMRLMGFPWQRAPDSNVCGSQFSRAVWPLWERNPLP